MIAVSAKFWKRLSIGLFIVVFIQFLLLTGVFDIRKCLDPSDEAVAGKEEGFETFEGIAFAREFSERYLTFDSTSFRNRQLAVAFLLDDQIRPARLAEIERLSEKIENRIVIQKARLVTLTKVGESTDRFRADLDVELMEGSGSGAHSSEFSTQLEFSIERTDRNSQNTWGFRVKNLSQKVIPQEKGLGTAPIFALRAGVATLIRFPCSIENVELPKGSSVRVKLTTLDISELQMRTMNPLTTEQSVRAVCRDRAFTMKLRPDDDLSGDLIVLKTLTMESAVVMLSAEALKAAARNRRKTGVEKSIEDQLGFVVEEE